MIIVDFGAFLGCRLKSTMILLSIDICLFIFSPVKDKILTNDRWGGDTFCKHGGFWTCSDRFHPGVYRERERERERERVVLSMMIFKSIRKNDMYLLNDLSPLKKCLTL